MRVVVFGSRDLFDLSTVAEAVDASGFHVTEVVSGGARGVDTLGEILAFLRGWPVRRFPYRRELRKAGGPVRNRDMAAYGEAGVGVPKPGLPNAGTNNMRRAAEARGLPVHMHGDGPRQLALL